MKILLVMLVLSVLGISFPWQTILAIIIGIYEVIVRIIPTVSNWSIVALIIKIIKAISDALNVTKK